MNFYLLRICVGFLFISSLLTALENPLHAQANDSLVVVKEGGWIESLDGYIMLKLIQKTDISSITQLTSDQNFYLNQNLKSNTSLGINYQFINFSVDFTLKFLPGNDDDSIRGSSSNKGFGINLVGRHWQQNLSYNRAKGYYLANTVDFDPSWHDGDPYLQLPGLTTTSYEGITAYSLNPQFSVKSLVLQTERQARSAGSFIPQLLYRYYITEDQTPVSPTGSSQKSNNFEFALGAGYYYTLVINKYFYFSLGATPAA